MFLADVHACAFTGRRPEALPWNNDESHPAFRDFLPVLRRSVLRAYQDGYRVFLSGMALGIDLIACDVVDALRNGSGSPGEPVCADVRLIGVVPGAGQASRWTLRDRERYRAALSRCDKVIDLGGRLTPANYMERNRYMVEHASRLIAVWDGNPTGGTYRTLTYARQKHLNIDLINLGPQVALRGFL